MGAQLTREKKPTDSPDQANPGQTSPQEQQQQPQPQQNQDKPARTSKNDWKTLGFEQAKSAPWHVPISAAQLRRLLQGFLPESMDDRWFVYADGPGPDFDGDAGPGRAVLHLHRSWTGYKIAEVVIKLDVKPRDKDGEVLLGEDGGKGEDGDMLSGDGGGGGGDGGDGGDGGGGGGGGGACFTQITWETSEKVVRGLEHEGLAKNRVRDICRAVLDVHLPAG